MSKMTQRQIDIIKEEIETIKENSIRAVYKKVGIEKSTAVEPLSVEKVIKKTSWRSC